MQLDGLQKDAPQVEDRCLYRTAVSGCRDKKMCFDGLGVVRCGLGVRVRILTPPHPFTQTQPTIAHPEDARANSLATQGYKQGHNCSLCSDLLEIFSRTLT